MQTQLHDFYHPLLLAANTFSSKNSVILWNTKKISVYCTLNCPNTHTKNKNSVCIGTKWCAVNTFIFTVNLYGEKSHQITKFFDLDKTSIHTITIMEERNTNCHVFCVVLCAVQNFSKKMKKSDLPLLIMGVIYLPTYFSLVPAQSE